MDAGYAAGLPFDLRAKQFVNRPGAGRGSINFTLTKAGMATLDDLDAGYKLAES